MCGIVGYVGERAAVPILLRALHDLEYRGYDSAGMALAGHEPGGEILVFKRAGKLANLEMAMAAAELASTAGIGHTRWATHGVPSDENAHPHASCDGRVVVIHNGIVENHHELRTELRKRGHEFRSDTDSETIAHLLEEWLRGGHGLLESLRLAAARLEGSQAIVALSSSEPGALAAARLGNAGGVVLGHGQGEMLVASDLAAVLPHTRHVSHLADGQFVLVTATGARCVDREGSPISLAAQDVPIDPESVSKGGFPNFMAKEIAEQPTALSDTIASLVTIDPSQVHPRDIPPGVIDRLRDVRRVVLIGMGTSLHAAMLGRQLIEEIAHLPAEADNASEFRYRSAVLAPGTLVVSISQSGETVDVLEAMHAAKPTAALQLTVCNTPAAQSTRVADGTIYTRAGLERGVASTKCFTTALAAIHVLALKLAELRDGPQEVRAEALHELARMPGSVADVLAGDRGIGEAAAVLARSKNALFLGRSLALPIALEGALKLKEISYIHAEGYAAGEMKHGPIALIDPDFPTVAIATRHAMRSKMLSNIQQIQARGGTVIAVATEGDVEVCDLADKAILVPAAGRLVEPIVTTVALQRLAYDVAQLRGCDVDQPRNLAKTVTVE